MSLFRTVFHTALHDVSRLPALLCIGVIQVYRWVISPWLAPRCRFHPTCSGYALQAIKTLPFPRALWLITRRLGRCHPWGGSGYDPVPPADAPLCSSHPATHTHHDAL